MGPARGGRWQPAAVVVLAVALLGAVTACTTARPGAPSTAPAATPGTATPDSVGASRPPGPGVAPVPGGLAGATRLVPAPAPAGFRTATPGTATPGTATPGTATPGTATPGTASSGLVLSFDGLDAPSSTSSEAQDSAEPPDQGLCAGKGQVVELVNHKVRVFAATGEPGPATGLNEFLGEQPRGAPGAPALFDPSCVYDPGSGAFYAVATDFGRGNQGGNGVHAGDLHIAVTHDPRGAWRVYRLSVRDDGQEGTPAHPRCPCIADYPHLGFDAHGVYVAADELALPESTYTAAQVYALDKRALLDGAAVRVTQFDLAHTPGGVHAVSLWPAVPASTADEGTADDGWGGTAHLLATERDRRSAGHALVLFSLTGTSSLGAAAPAARLHATRIPVAPFAAPPPAEHRGGPLPLAACLALADCGSRVGAEAAAHPRLLHLDANLAQMQQVTFASGLVHGAHGTAVTVGRRNRAGIAWYAVRPLHGPVPSGRLESQHRLARPDADLTHPALGMTATGLGVLAFTLSGPGTYPSAAFTRVGPAGAGPVQVAGPGRGPYDSVSYALQETGGAASWGDYGAASVDGRDVWVASEFVASSCTLEQYRAEPFGTCAGTRRATANWSTRISLVRP